VLDEIHLLSPAQIEACRDILPDTPILGLSGTLSSWTERDLKQQLKLPVVSVYPIEQAISEGVIADYEISIVRVNLDNSIKVKYKQGLLTEKAMFDRYGWIINKLDSQGRDAMFPRLARMRIIQNSLAKQRKTIHLLEEMKDERVLVFCGIISIADNLGIPSYHSRSDEKDLFEKFMHGEGNHMAVVRIGNTGVTYKPLNRVIINYFDSNPENLAQKIQRCMSMEYDNPDKKAQILIVCTTEDVERKWLNKALEFFDKSKIKWL
jgi:superfamily II DNA or RNA helicase